MDYLTNGFSCTTYKVLIISTNGYQITFSPMILIRSCTKVFYITTNDLQYTCQPMVLILLSPTVFTSAPMIVKLFSYQ